LVDARPDQAGTVRILQSEVELAELCLVAQRRCPAGRPCLSRDMPASAGCQNDWTSTTVTWRFQVPIQSRVCDCQTAGLEYEAGSAPVLSTRWLYLPRCVRYVVRSGRLACATGTVRGRHDTYADSIFCEWQRGPGCVVVTPLRTRNAARVRARRIAVLARQHDDEPVLAWGCDSSWGTFVAWYTTLTCPRMSSTSTTEPRRAPSSNGYTSLGSPAFLTVNVICVATMTRTLTTRARLSTRR